MEIWIPSQTLDIHNIHLRPFQSQLSQKILLAPLQYIDNAITLNNLTIVTPPVEVLHHDMQTGKLILNLADQHMFSTKMQMLQTYLASTLYTHQQSFFGFSNPVLTIDFFKRMLFPLVYNKKMTLFMGASARTVQVYKKGGAAAAAAAAPGISEPLQQGAIIRVAFQLQGISILASPSLAILQGLSVMPANAADISGVISMCKIRFQQAMKAIYIV
jgi:hypothetical protein